MKEREKPFVTTEGVQPVDMEDSGLTSADYYFDSYAHFGIHEEMLKDNVRTGSYRSAILKNKHLFQDKIVLDVGSGTGILSMFAAQAGAKHVYAVECSSIARSAKAIIAANNFSDKITVVVGKIEEISLPEGMIFPDKATLYLSAIEDRDYRAQKIDYWKNVYGFDMTCIREQALTEPLVDICEPDTVISNSVPIMTFNIESMNIADVDFVTKFALRYKRNDYCHAIVAFFSVEFSHCHTKTFFSTGPLDPYTHWKQTVFYLDDELVVSAGDILYGEIKVSQNKNNVRDLDIIFATALDGKHCNTKQSRFYRLR